jgi:hypothetical protein
MAEINLTDSWRLKDLAHVVTAGEGVPRNQPYRLLEVESTLGGTIALDPASRNQPYRLLEVERSSIWSTQGSGGKQKSTLQTLGG